MATAEEHLRELLKQPVEERARAAKLLLESLDIDLEDDREAASLGSVEIRRRVRSIEDGTAALIDADVARQRIHERLRQIRSEASTPLDQSRHPNK